MWLIMICIYFSSSPLLLMVQIQQLIESDNYVFEFFLSVDCEWQLKFYFINKFFLQQSTTKLEAPTISSCTHTPQLFKLLLSSVGGTMVATKVKETTMEDDDDDCVDPTTRTMVLISQHVTEPTYSHLQTWLAK